MRAGVERDLSEVFSILSEDRIGDAVSTTLGRIAGLVVAGPTLLKWADFDARGRFLRGGVSNLSDYTTTLAASPGSDPAIAAMAREAADGAAQPGRVVCSPDREAFVLFLPGTAASATAAPVPTVRGFLIDLPVFSTVLAAFGGENRLTEAERRVAFQLVAGVSLRQAADLDRVSVETKRAQIKSAAAKMQCAGQVDLVRTLTGQLAYVLALADNEAGHAGFAERFVATRLDGDARLSVERLPNGRIARCIECGPAEGRPVVVLHGMMFGMLLSGAGPYLEAEGLRLLMPIRHGYLDARPVLDLRGTGRMIAESLEDLSLLLARRSLAPATLLGHSLGANLAISFAARHPGLADRLVLLSTNRADPGAEQGGYAGRLYGGYKRLTRRDGLTRAITLEFSRHYRDREASRTILHRLFGHTPADVAALEGDGTALPVYDWFADLYASSVAGISEDYDFAMTARPPLRLPAIPALFVHGTEDPLTPVDRIAALAATWPGARIAAVEGAGHFVSATHAGAMWRAVAGFAPA